MLPHPDKVMNNLSRIAKYQRIPITGGVRVRIGLRALSSCIWVDFNLTSSKFNKKGFLNASNTHIDHRTADFPNTRSQCRHTRLRPRTPSRTSRCHIPFRITTIEGICQTTAIGKISWVNTTSQSSKRLRRGLNKNGLCYESRRCCNRVLSSIS